MLEYDTPQHFDRSGAPISAFMPFRIHLADDDDAQMRQSSFQRS